MSTTQIPPEAVTGLLDAITRRLTVPDGLDSTGRLLALADGSADVRPALPHLRRRAGRGRVAHLRQLGGAHPGPAGAGEHVIPVRVPAGAKPTLGSERVIDLNPTHPIALSETPCPACDGPLAGTKVVLVFVGIAPEDRKESGWTTGGAVTVHATCAGVAP